MDNHISAVTRREILDHVATCSTGWRGALQEVEFLARLYNLTSIPSGDSRQWNIADEIIRHRVIWNDWSDDWILTDPRLNLLEAADEMFLRFLCETVHPSVRPDADEALRLVDFYNIRLMGNGWRITEAEKISGKPAYKYRREDEEASGFISNN